MPPRRRARMPRYPRNPDLDTRSMMSGMMDMGKMAVGGAIVVGTIGAVGSILKK